MSDDRNVTTPPPQPPVAPAAAPKDFSIPVFGGCVIGMIGLTMIVAAATLLLMALKVRDNSVPMMIIAAAGVAAAAAAILHLRMKSNWTLGIMIGALTMLTLLGMCGAILTA